MQTKEGEFLIGFTDHRMNIKASNLLFSQCKCLGDNRPKKLTGMGCKNGGMPWCPTTNKPQTDSVCRDGTPMYMNEVLEYRTEFRSDCICKDGFSPRCRETNRHGCQMAIAGFLDRMCLSLRASGLWLRYATCKI